MKHIYVFLTIFITSICSIYAKTVNLNIPDSDIKIVENDVIDAEVWIREAWAGKLNKCKERIVKQEMELSIKNNEPIPAGETAIVNKFFSRPGYKSRKDREGK